MSAAIALALKQSHSVNLAAIISSPWDRVCFIGPYSDNARAKQVLGFDWPVESKTSISNNDGETVLVFVRAGAVERYLEHPRNLGDFADLSSECFNRNDATFRLKDPTSDWPFLIPTTSPISSLRHDPAHLP